MHKAPGRVERPLRPTLSPTRSSSHLAPGAIAAYAYMAANRGTDPSFFDMTDRLVVLDGDGR